MVVAHVNHLGHASDVTVGNKAKASWFLCSLFFHDHTILQISKLEEVLAKLFQLQVVRESAYEDLFILRIDWNWRFGFYDLVLWFDRLWKRWTNMRLNVSMLSIWFNNWIDGTSIAHFLLLRYHEFMRRRHLNLWNVCHLVLILFYRILTWSTIMQLLSNWYHLGRIIVISFRSNSWTKLLCLRNDIRWSTVQIWVLRWLNAVRGG